MRSRFGLHMFRGSVILVIFTVCSMFLLTSNSYACSCIEPPPPKEALEKSFAVFSGKVLEIQEPPREGIRSSADPINVVIEVNEVWKGDVGETVTVTTAMDGASCGYSFVIGEEYIVYTNGDEDLIRVSLCSRTALLSGADEDLQSLGAGTVNPNYGSSGDDHSSSDADPNSRSVPYPDSSSMSNADPDAKRQHIPVDWGIVGIIAVSIVVIVVVALAAFRVNRKP